MMVKPAIEGAMIRDPNTRLPLRAEGANMPMNSFWLRRLRTKEVILMDAEGVPPDSPSAPPPDPIPPEPAEPPPEAPVEAPVEEPAEPAQVPAEPTDPEPRA
jgi:Protein of unknown function (DUF2635)